jgi:hypothetical protein
MRATLADGRIVELWTAEEVEARLEEAAETLRRMRMHGIWPAKHRTAWPEMLQDFWEIWRFGRIEDGPPPPPAPGAIDRMDEALVWVAMFVPANKRRILWARAFRFSWRRIGRRIGKGHETVRRAHRQALLALAEELNRGHP